jgi:hypothetical protein
LCHSLSLLENAEFSLQITPDRYYTSRFYDDEAGFLPPGKIIHPPAMRTPTKTPWRDRLSGLMKGMPSDFYIGYEGNF